MPFNEGQLKAIQQRDASILAVSYTHLDVYKRQLLKLVIIIRNKVKI